MSNADIRENALAAPQSVLEIDSQPRTERSAVKRICFLLNCFRTAAAITNVLVVEVNLFNKTLTIAKQHETSET